MACAEKSDGLLLQAGATAENSTRARILPWRGIARCCPDDWLGAGNRRGFAELAGSDALRDHAKQIKEHTLAHLDRYLEQLEASVQKVGGHVHWAANAEDEIEK